MNRKKLKNVEEVLRKKPEVKNFDEAYAEMARSNMNSAVRTMSKMDERAFASMINDLCGYALSSHPMTADVARLALIGVDAILSEIDRREGV